MQIFCISGKAEHGKDFLATHLKDAFEKKGKRVCLLHYADYLKLLAKVAYGWDGRKDDKGREILQKLGTDIARKQNPNVWVNVVKEAIKALKNEFDYFIIPDCRFENEIISMRESFGNTTAIRIVRPEHVSKLTIEQLQHPSETALDDFNFDYWIYARDAVEMANVSSEFVEEFNE